MKYTDSKFVEAIELIQASEGNQKRKDKRRAARTVIRVPVKVKLGIDPSVQWTEAKLRDISARGMRMEISDEMEVGSSFLIRLPSKTGKETDAPLICRVAHCVKQRTCFLIGAEFTGRWTPVSSNSGASGDLDRIQRSILD